MDNQAQTSIIIPAFKDVDPAPSLTSQSHVGGSPSLYKPGGLETIQIGTGFTVFNVDSQGMWMGAPRFSTAPFRVSMSGEMLARLIDSENNIISDAIGLKSTSSFVKDEVTQDVDQTFTGTDFVSSTQLVLALAGLPRPTVALVYISLAGYHDDVDGRMEFRLLLNAGLNSQQQGQVICVNRVAAAGTVQSAFLAIPVLLSQGDNSLVIQGRSSNANSGYLKGTVIPSTLGCLLLGK